MKLSKEFYLDTDVVAIARKLIGKYLFTEIAGILTGGIITETEAYAGETDKASHAYGGRRTSRTEIMYHEGGQSYVYLCYGIHSLFNVVTNKENIPHAVLIRAVFPVEGLSEILARRKNNKLLPSKLIIGPGNVAQAFGIHYSDTGKSLLGTEIWIEDRSIKIPKSAIISGPRIGVDYAGADALLPYRFSVSHSLCIDFKSE